MTQRETIFVISRLGGGEENLLGDWGILPPNKILHAAYLDELGRRCAAESAAVVLLQSSKDLAAHLHEAFAATGSKREATYILVHPGMGKDLSVAIKGVLKPREIQRLPVNLATHSFALDSGSRLAAFLHELADYVRRTDSVLFQVGVALLRDALRDAIQAARGNLSNAKARASAAADYIENRRNHVGLGARLVISVKPVVTISHRTLSRFDALSIDLQHSVRRADLWKRIRIRHQGSIGKGLSILSGVVHGSGRIDDLHNFGDLVRAIVDSGRLSEKDLTALTEALATLRALVPATDRTCWIGSFLQRVDLGDMETLTADDAAAFRDWLYRVRTSMRVIGRAHDLAFAVSKN